MRKQNEVRNTQKSTRRKYKNWLVTCLAMALLLGHTALAAEEPPQITTAIPLISGMSHSTLGAPAGTILDITGDVKENAEDKTYDYTETRIVTPGSITIRTQGITTTDKILAESTALNLFHSTVVPTSTNDLIYENASRPTYADDSDNLRDGYQFIYVGTGNTSQFRPALVFTKPTMEGEQTTVGPDGITYYLGRLDPIGNAHKVEGWYQNGAWISPVNTEKYGAIYATSQQFVMMDPITGKVATVYCADLSTYAEQGYGYNIQNLEDADYYTPVQAAQIRTIAANGYWDDGSLAAMKERLRTVTDANGNRTFPEEDLAKLTDGVALTATQMAIWSCSNPMSGALFVNSHYVGNPADLSTDKSGYGALGNVPSEKEAETILMFKLAEYLKTLPSTTTTQNTADTIIHADNFLEDISITAKNKVADHPNNLDTDTTNDVYTVQLNFKPKVTPSTANGDNLIVRILDTAGNTMAEGRIAGLAISSNPSLTPDANGYYTFQDITMMEGEQTVLFSLEGTQKLAGGVYLYTSESRTDDTGAVTTSQTMVGLADGNHKVNVTMNLNFELGVNDQVTITEHYQNIEEPIVNPPVNPPVYPPFYPPVVIPPVVTPPAEETPETEAPTEELPEEELPEETDPEDETDKEETNKEDTDKEELVDIPEEEVPVTDKPELAEVPKTGAVLPVGLLLYPLTSASLLIGISFANKKRRK